MDYTIWLSIIASVASILGLIISIFRDQRLIIKIILILSFILFSCTSIYIAHLHNELHRREAIEKSGHALMNKKYDSSHLGFVHASLTFLEVNKDLYPDTYKRAIKIAEDMESSTSIYAEMDAASAMKDILCGIAILNENK